MQIEEDDALDGRFVAEPGRITIRLAGARTSRGLDEEIVHLDALALEGVSRVAERGHDAPGDARLFGQLADGGLLERLVTVDVPLREEPVLGMEPGAHQ